MKKINLRKIINWVKSDNLWLLLAVVMTIVGVFCFASAATANIVRAKAADLPVDGQNGTPEVTPEATPTPTPEVESLDEATKVYLRRLLRLDELEKLSGTRCVVKFKLGAGEDFSVSETDSTPFVIHINKPASVQIICIGNKSSVVDDTVKGEEM